MNEKELKFLEKLANSHKEVYNRQTKKYEIFKKEKLIPKKLR